MGRHYNTARRIDFVRRRFPRLRKRIEDIGRRYYYIQENWDYDIDYNGERWLARQLAGDHKLSNVFDVGANGGEWMAMVLEEYPQARGYKVAKLFPDSVRFRTYHLSDENFPGSNYVAAAPGFVPWLQSKS